jgi:hypothetical protein
MKKEKIDYGLGNAKGESKKGTEKLVFILPIFRLGVCRLWFALSHIHSYSPVPISPTLTHQSVDKHQVLII